MRQLTAVYGPKKPFNDNELFAKITELTYPEVGTFLTTYVSGTTPIPYDAYFAKMGVAKAKTKKAANPFMNNYIVGITVDTTTRELKIKNDVTLSPFLTGMGLKGGDVIVDINGKLFTIETMSEGMTAAQNWKEGDTVTMKIKRDGVEKNLTGKATYTYEESEGYKLVDTTKEALKNSWLKG